MTLIDMIKSYINNRQKDKYRKEKAKAERLYNDIQRSRFYGGTVTIDAYTLQYLEKYGFYF